MPKNLGNWLIHGILLLSILDRSVSRAEDAVDLVHPATIVTRSGPFDLTAGKILVQQGDNLNEWWKGEGTDAETQSIVKERVKTLLNEALRAELLKKLMIEMQTRGGKAKSDATRPTLDLMEPVFRQELTRKYRIEEWSANAPEANTYIEEWLSTRVAAKIMAGLIAKKWYRHPDRNDEAFAYWEMHQGEFKIMKTGTWEQISLASDSPKIREFESLFGAEAAQKRHVSPLSEETFRQYGQRVTSEFPHQSIHPLIPKVFEAAQPGDQHRIPIGRQLVYLRLVEAEYRNGSYDEVASEIKDRLAIINEERILNSLFIQHQPPSRVGMKSD